MKLYLISATLLLWSVSSGITFAAPPTVTLQFQIPAMKCSGCSWAISESLKKLDGVSAVHVDWKTKTALLETASMELPGKDAISRAVDSVGYTTSKFRRLQLSFAAAKRQIEEGE